MRPVFADPKANYAFKLIFGVEVHKRLLIELLNALLELEDEHRIVDLEYLSREQRVHIDALRRSLVDVKCYDQRSQHYVVKIQILNVEGFEKQVVYDTSKVYAPQSHTGEGYPEPGNIFGITICDFNLWPDPPQPGGPAAVPMLSRWRMQEQHGGAQALSQVQYVFLELPKYEASEQPQGLIDRWAYFFRAAENLDTVPPALAVPPFSEALEVARLAHFSTEGLHLYDRAKMARQDLRGALSLAWRRGYNEARARVRAKRRAAGLEETVTARELLRRCHKRGGFSTADLNRIEELKARDAPTTNE